MTSEQRNRRKARTGSVSAKRCWREMVIDVECVDDVIAQMSITFASDRRAVSIAHAIARVCVGSVTEMSTLIGLPLKATLTDDSGSPGSTDDRD